MKHKFLAASALALGAVAMATSANAVVIQLNFEGIANSYPHSNTVAIQSFYDGGTSSDGVAGPNLGVGFSDNAFNICLNTIATTCSNTSRGGVGDPNSQLGALFFLSGSETFMNVAAGFDTGFAFNYTAISQGGSVSAFDGLNGTGTLLGTLILPTTPSNCPGFNAGFCPFVETFLAFAGIAKSISFSGVANQIVFDDVTFGAITTSPVPLPAALPLFATGVAGLAALRRRKRKAS